MDTKFRMPTLAQIEAEIAAAEADVKEAGLAKVTASRDVQTAARQFDDAVVRLGLARHWLYIRKDIERCRQRVQP